MTVDTFPNRLNQRIWRAVRFPYTTKCPVCAATISLNKLFKALRRSKRSGKKESAVCPSCKTALQFERGRRYNFVFALSIFMFLFSAVIGSAVFSQFDATSYFHEARGGVEPNFLGFLLTIVLFVYPAASMTFKLLKIEVVE